LQSYPTTVSNERMRHFEGWGCGWVGSNHTLTPPTYFQGIKALHRRIALTGLHNLFRCRR